MKVSFPALFTEDDLRRFGSGVEYADPSAPDAEAQRADAHGPGPAEDDGWRDQPVAPVWWWR